MHRLACDFVNCPTLRYHCALSTVARKVPYRTRRWVLRYTAQLNIIEGYYPQLETVCFTEIITIMCKLCFAEADFMPIPIEPIFYTGNSTVTH